MVDAGNKGQPRRGREISGCRAYVADAHQDGNRRNQCSQTETAAKKIDGGHETSQASDAAHWQRNQHGNRSGDVAGGDENAGDHQGSWHDPARVLDFLPHERSAFTAAEGEEDDWYTGGCGLLRR